MTGTEADKTDRSWLIEHGGNLTPRNGIRSRYSTYQVVLRMRYFKFATASEVSSPGGLKAAAKTLKHAVARTIKSFPAYARYEDVVIDEWSSILTSNRIFKVTLTVRGLGSII